MAISLKNAGQVLWNKGHLFWYLYPYQLEVYKFIRNTRNPFFEATRRFGKTTTLLAKQCEDCQTNEQRVVVWCEPWKEQARNIVIPEMQKICNYADEANRPKFYRTDSFFEFPKTGSRMYLVGVCEDRAEGARGRTAHEIVCDELGSWVEAEYIINEVLRPLLLTTGGQMIEMGTPPRDLGHLWYDKKSQAIIDKRYIGRDFDSVESIGQREKDEFVESMGGRNSTAVRRELYLEPVADEESLVIPEFKDKLHVVDQIEMPDYFDAYVGADFGFNDNTAFVFGFYDFLRATLFIQGEIIVKAKNTKDIVALCKQTELRIWGNKQPHLRVGDNELQQLYDMQTEHNYYVAPTRKDDKLSAINELRLRFQAGKIMIHKDCVNLIYQLKVGMWDDRRKNFVRGEKTGHLDALDALIYLNRNVSETKNPYPPEMAFNKFTQFVSPQVLESKRKDKELLQAFQPFGDLDG